MGKIVPWEELFDEFKKREQSDDYNEFCIYIQKLEDENKIEPVKVSGGNGKHSKIKTLCKRYRYIDPEIKSKDQYIYELTHQIVPMIRITTYLKNLLKYKEDREKVLQLNEFLKNHKEELTIQVAINERSFAIWKDEKYLRGKGQKILKNCGLSLEIMNVYIPVEPFVYYKASEKTPQNILIIENQDTFYSIRKKMIEGERIICGKEFGTLILGKGKAIESKLGKFEEHGEPYMVNPENTILYFGDLDYEGIGIYERLQKRYEESVRMAPFVEAYEKMISLNMEIDVLKDTKEAQNRNISGYFFSYFDKENIEKMKKILKADKYIPQESISAITDKK